MSGPPRFVTYGTMLGVKHGQMPGRPEPATGYAACAECTGGIHDSTNDTTTTSMVDRDRRGLDVQARQRHRFDPIAER